MRINIDLDSNFWDVNTQYKYREPFKSYYKQDKSKGKKESSNVIWFCTLYFHQDSAFSNISEDERAEVIGAGFLNDEEYYIKHRELLDKWLKIIQEQVFDTPAKKALKMWDKKIEQRSLFMDSIDYNIETFEMLDKMSITTKKIYDEYQRILADLDKEADDSSLGNRESSFTEKLKGN